MLLSVKKYWAGWLRGLAGLACASLLAGCASTLSARVTTFQQWPGDAQGATYRIVPPSGQGDALEVQAFSDMIRAAIGRTGLVEATQGVKPRFDVQYEYGSPVSQAWVQRYYDPYFDGGFGLWGGFGGYRGWGWGGGFYYTPPVVNVPVQVHKNTLTVTIKDNQRQGAQVYKSSAVNASSGDNLVEVMPYLARAVFDGFPGNNGQVREVNYERQR